jgi:cytochrome c
MESLEVTKVSTAVLVAGIAFFLSGWIGASIVHPDAPAKPVIEIKGAAPEAAATAPPPEEKLAPIGPFLAAADPAAGEKTFKQDCSVCHTSNEGGKAGVGPNLYDVIGGPHAHMEGFNYTAGLKAKKGPWTFEELNEWLHKPSSYVPGTRMTFQGIANEKIRANVIDYLHTLAPHPLPLPPAPSVANPAPPPEAAPAAAPAAKGAAAPAPAAKGTAAPAPAAAPAAKGAAAPAPAAAPAAKAAATPTTGAAPAATPAPAPAAAPPAAASAPAATTPAPAPAPATK